MFVSSLKNRRMRRVALFFGSFNPIHIGHLALGNYVAEFGGVDEVRFVVSPHNPLKERGGLMDDEFRLEMVRRAIEGYPKFGVSDVEFRLPKPSYTYDTLTFMSQEEPDVKFVLIMGGDNLDLFRKWRNYDKIMEQYEVLVYPRPDSSNEVPDDYKNVSVIDAPLIEVSSTFIRESLRDGKDVRFFMPQGVAEMMSQNSFL